MTDRELDDMVLIAAAIKMADDLSDGHVTIIKSTYHWRVGFRSPGRGEEAPFEYVGTGLTLREALSGALREAVREEEEAAAYIAALRNGATVE